MSNSRRKDRKEGENKGPLKKEITTWSMMGVGHRSRTGDVEGNSLKGGGGVSFALEEQSAREGERPQKAGIYG